MNNAIITGNVGNSVQAGLFDFLNTGNTDNSDKGNFLSLLQNRLKFDSGMSDKGVSSLISARKELSEGFGNKGNEFRPLNVWERPHDLQEVKYVDKIKRQVADKSVNQQRKSLEKEKANKSDSPEQNKIADREKLEKIMSTLESDPEIEKLLSGLSYEEISALAESLQQLNPSSLELIAGNSNAFVGQLLSDLDKLPTTPETENLKELFSSEDFSRLLEALVGVVKQTGKAANSNMTSDASEMNANQSGLYPDEGKKGAGIVGNVNFRFDKAKTTEDSTDEANATLTGEQSADDENHSGSDQEFTIGKKAFSKDKEKNAEAKNNKEANSNNEFAATARNEESLRETFNRIHKLNVKSAGNLESSVQASTKPAQEQADSFEGKISNADNFAKQIVPESVSQKLVSSLLHKNSGYSGKIASFSYGPAIQGNNKTSNIQNNTGGSNGYGNGFSSSHGGANSSIAGSKQAPAQPGNVFLSQLIEKAEMIKGVDGKKTLSLELDPKELGKMEIELTSKDGTVTAKISAENDLAKAKIEELAPQIKEHLNAQGINLSEITVDISSRHPDERNKHHMSDGKNKSSRTEKVSATSDEQIIRKNILPNLRKVALNIQSVDLTV
ncbi:MAG: hypothetical protein Kow0029_02870 [Candidatus Rifleibacteriota bacterium]